MAKGGKRKNADAGGGSGKGAKAAKGTPGGGNAGGAEGEGDKGAPWNPMENNKPVVVQATRQDVVDVAETVGLAAAANDPKVTIKPKDGLAAMRWLLAPVPVKRFLSKYYEKRPLLIQREDCADYYKNTFSTEEVDRIVRTKGMQYTYNVDVTRLDNDGHRRTFNSNLDGSTDTVDGDTVWKRYKEDGCSVRLLHPQRFSDTLWPLMSQLETFWTSAVGCNTYLTPPSSQGFAPHWDDIDAFILQVEGRKHWRVYAPRELDEVLPRASSEDFTEGEVGKPILEVELKPGDLLYMPRGFIHQANCVETDHSLHLTISANQGNTYADLVELALSAALQVTSEENHAMRQSLPPDYTSYMGVMHSDKEGHALRREFLLKCNDLFAEVVNNIPWDDAADQMAVRYLEQRLPVYGRRGGGGAAAAGGGGGKGKGKGKAAPLDNTSCIKLAGKDVARLAVEGDKAVLYHILDNTRESHMALGEGAEEPDPDKGVLEFDIGAAEILEELLSAFPKPVELDLWDEEWLRVAQLLFDKGIVVAAAASTSNAKPQLDVD